MNNTDIIILPLFTPVLGVIIAILIRNFLVKRITFKNWVLIPISIVSFFSLSYFHNTLSQLVVGKQITSPVYIHLFTVLFLSYAVSPILYGPVANNFKSLIAFFITGITFIASNGGAFFSFGTDSNPITSLQVFPALLGDGISYFLIFVFKTHFKPIENAKILTVTPILFYLFGLLILFLLSKAMGIYFHS